MEPRCGICGHLASEHEDDGSCTLCNCDEYEEGEFPDDEEEE